MPIVTPIRVEAELFVREMKAGRNGAVHVRARGADGVAFDCVVKLAAGMAEEQRAMLPIPYLCEWLAAAIGTALGMTIAAPYEVVVTKDYADAVTDAKHRTIALASLGSAFGSGYASVATSQYTLELPDLSLRTPAAELVAFDTYIHNPDRRTTNPNLFVSRGELVAFDHGDAFSFLLPLLLAPDPVVDSLEKCVDEHACRPWLRKREFILDRFRGALVTLTDQVFDEIVAATPSAWTDGAAQGRLSYVVDVMKKRRDAASEWLPKVEEWLRK